MSEQRAELLKTVWSIFDENLPEPYRPFIGFDHFNQVLEVKIFSHNKEIHQLGWDLDTEKLLRSSPGKLRVSLTRILKTTQQAILNHQSIQAVEK